MYQLFRHNMIRISTIVILLVLSAGAAYAQKNNDALTEEGVSLALAQHRKSTISDVAYHLYFHIPKDKTQCVTGTNSINITLAKRGDVILDFKADASQVKAVSCNGKSCDYSFANEHIIIPAKYTH